jgi:hypothetical protein
VHNEIAQKSNLNFGLQQDLALDKRDNVVGLVLILDAVQILLITPKLPKPLLKRTNIS